MKRRIEIEIIETARELGVGIVASSPLRKEFLPDIAILEELEISHIQRMFPTHTPPETSAQKLKFAIFDYAKKIKCTPAQLALAWVHAQGDDIFPISGSETPALVEEYLGALNIKLSERDLIQIEDIIAAETGNGTGDHFDHTKLTPELFHDTKK